MCSCGTQTLPTAINSRAFTHNASWWPVACWRAVVELVTQRYLFHCSEDPRTLKSLFYVNELTLIIIIGSEGP